MLVRFVLILFCLAATHAVVGQSKSKKDKGKAKSGQPTSLEPYFPQMDYAPEKSKAKRSGGITYNAQARYYDRMEEVAKERKKAEKEMMKPQYSDPMYFGHKRPPKKHKPSKMKFCKVCGIRH